MTLRLNSPTYPPTAQPVSRLAKCTEYKASVVPLVWGVQETPPFTVFRMVPVAPTAQPTSALMKWTEDRALVVPLVWGDQVWASALNTKPSNAIRVLNMRMLP